MGQQKKERQRQRQRENCFSC